MILNKHVINIQTNEYFVMDFNEDYVPEPYIEVIEKPSSYHIYENNQWVIDTELWLNNSVRVERDTLINQYVWMVDRHKQQKDLYNNGNITINELSLTEQQYIELLVYLQQLRDLPETITFENQIFPVKPLFLN